MDTSGILVGYDGSPAADVAARWAARTARLREEPVTALIVIEPVHGSHDRRHLEDRWREVQERAGTVLREESGGRPVRVECHAGPIVATLVEAAESSSTLVVGSQGHSRLAELLLNSVSQETARKARVPLVVVRPEPSRRTYGVLVGVDGSRPSLRALDFACRHAALTDDHVSVMTGWRSGAAPVGAHGTGVLLSTRVHHEQDMLERVVAEARIAHPSLTIEPHLVHRDPGRALTDASASAALVVVGCQGLTALEEVVLGSVSQQVLRRARCPVAVVH